MICILHRNALESYCIATKLARNNFPFDLNLLRVREKYFFGKFYDKVDICLYTQDQIIFQIPIFSNIWPYFFSLRYPLPPWYLPCKKRSRSSAGPISSLQLLNAPLERRSKFTLLVRPQSSTSWHKSGLWINLYSKLYCRCKSFR